MYSIMQGIGNLTQSASKVAFLTLVSTACLAFLLGRLDQGTFKEVLMAAAIFYFSHKGDVTQPYAGK